MTASVEHSRLSVRAIAFRGASLINGTSVWIMIK